ncbi:MAG: hypothetical protein JNM17_14085 [Archangium sp.]|nr:hypothetical protein [Archangium sp.]
MSQRLVMTFAVCALGASCGVPPSPQDGGADASVFVPTERRPLGLNDVTYFLPLEQLDASTPFPPASTILPLGAFTRLTEAQPVVRTDLSRLRVLAVRVDACDRADTLPCASDADGSMRLVLQPVFGAPANVEDVTFHAFFPIPRAQMPEVVDTLRALGAMQNIARGAPLQISTAFRSDSAFRTRLGALVARYAQSQRLNRLTLFGQESERAAIVWIFRGEEVPTGGAVLGPITIPSIAMPQQEVLLFGGDSYQVTPVADEPVGFARIVMEPMFRAGTSSQQLDGVRALLAVDNPSLHSANSAQCVSCHVSTTLVPLRSADAGIDVHALSERYTSAEFDLTPLGSTGRARTLRALGYFGSSPLVSQRVVNESVNVVGALESAYPPAP